MITSYQLFNMLLYKIFSRLTSTIVFQTDEKRCAQIAVESIITWGESGGVVDLPQETARAIAADATYRLRQSLNVCTVFHSIKLD